MDALTHDLLPRLDPLRACRSTPEAMSSAASRGLIGDVWRLLDTVVVAGAAGPSPTAKPFVRAVAWNIERGIHLERIIDRLASHPLLREADLYFLTELDFGMARSGNRDVAGEIARALGLHFAFAPCYLNLSKGGGVERLADTSNRYGLHGNALLSRWPLRDAVAVRLPNGKDKMRGPEKRLGSQQAIVATADLPTGRLRCASLHLDAHSTRGHRRRQMARVVQALAGEPAALIGGDWNTSTHNTNRAAWAIGGFWVRVLMGVQRCLRDHYPHPDRFFERRLFRAMERAGFEYRSLNEPGGCTLQHHILRPKDRENLRDWLPTWCLAYVEWALKPFGGVCPLKLDWFAGRGLRAARHPAAVAPLVVRDATDSGGRLSDHDPIVLDFVLTESVRAPASPRLREATHTRAAALLEAVE